LQGVAGSGEKELPRRLSAIGVHEALRLTVITLNLLYLYRTHSLITSNRRVTWLWKSVESEEKPERACSGCGGDYEDPDRSAWEEFEAADQDLMEEWGDEPGLEE
jgi:hypothetical protein